MSVTVPVSGTTGGVAGAVALVAPGVQAVRLAASAKPAVAAAIRRDVRMDVPLHSFFHQRWSLDTYGELRRLHNYKTFNKYLYIL